MPLPAGRYPAEMTAVSCTGLVKMFGSTRALDGLDLEVRSGEVHGFVGPNGAGKTVTMRILLGLYRQDSGEARVLDQDPWNDAVQLHRRLAYVPGDTNLWPNLTGGEIIDVLGGLRGGLDAARRTELLERFDLDPTKKARTYSKGNRQKVALVAAFASDAELFILDEPTSGLDPLMEATFRDYVAERRAEGHTILLSSHELAEVEKLCDRVTIIRHGRMVQSGSLDELRLLTRTTMIVETNAPTTAVAGLPGVHGVRHRGGRLTFEVDSGGLDAVIRELANHDVHSLVSHPPTLEELFLRHYGDVAEGTDAALPHDGSNAVHESSAP